MKYKTIGLISLVSAFSPTALSAIMTDMGTLGGTYSVAHGLSADGSVMIGHSDLANGESHGFKYTDTGGMVDLGTLGGSFSQARYVSANGLVIIGHSDLANGESHGFKYTDAAGMVDLGTLGGDSSVAMAVSADGSVMIGHSDLANGEGHAFKYTDATRMVDLGTLGGRFSEALAVSADGLVIIGYSDLANNERHAFKYTDAARMVDLGTLGGGLSIAQYVSANGSVIAGASSLVSGNNHGFKYTDTGGMVDLGTLGGIYSYVLGLSVDGSVITGHSGLANGDEHAFKHTDVGGMVDLGTLGGSYSYVEAISANGSVITGLSALANGDEHAFKHTDVDGMVDLGTLGGNYSYGHAVSADGSVIAGASTNANGELRAFIYKTKMIDVIDSIKMLQKGDGQQTAALSFLQDKLTDALNQGCRPDEGGNTCFAAGGKYYQQSNHAVDDTAAYVNIAHRFQPKVYAGIYLEQSVSSGFADSIDAKNELPLVAVYGGFSPSGSKRGLQVRAAAATHKINADITRPAVVNTEAGKGSTDFNGYSGQLEAAYAVQATDKLLISPVVGVRYSNVERGGYTESASVDFPATYGKMKSQQTGLFAGLEAEANLSKKVNVYASAGLEQVLDHSEETFSVAVPYIGAFQSGEPDVRETKAYAFTGISYEIASNQKVGFGVGYRQSNFKSGSDGLNAQIGYSVTF